MLYYLKKYASTILFGALLLTASFSLVRNIPEWRITGKWIGTIATVIISGSVLSITNLFTIKPEYRCVPTARACSFCMLSMNLAVAVYCLLQMAGLANNETLFRAVADFDNPAGVAALFCVTFPFIIILSRHKTNILLVVTLFVIDASVLFAIQSRAGLVAITVSTVVWLLSLCAEKKIKPGTVILISLLVAVVIGGVTFLFYYKSASTNGRMVIFNTCIRMVAARPLLGYGFGGFGREYMNWQAEYLKTIDHDNILMLSDNVTHPLSEYMLVAVNYGLIGLAVVIGVITIAVVRAFRQKGRQRAFILMEICSLCTLSFFSYPFRYPMTSIVVVCLIVLFLSHRIKKFQLSYRRPAVAFVLAVSLVSITFLWPWYKVQVQWKSISDRLNLDAKSAIVVKHDILPYTDKVLIRNPRYMYSRAVVNYYAGDYQQALNDAKNSSDKLSSYDTELLLGSICQKIGLNVDAETHYREASYMCPSRITPLYSLFRLYEEQGDTTNIVIVGHELLDKPVKVASHETRAMRLDVKRKLLYL